MREPEPLERDRVVLDEDAEPNRDLPPSPLQIAHGADDGASWSLIGSF